MKGVVVMVVNLHGDALRLLEHFVYYATGEHSKDLADAMFYSELAFLSRARLLEKALRQAVDNDSLSK
jgi:hypothetical protein